MIKDIDDFLFKNIRFNNYRKFIERFKLQPPFLSIFIVFVLICILLPVVFNLFGSKYLEIQIGGIVILASMILTIYRILYSVVENRKYWISNIYKISDTQLLLKVYKYDNIIIDGVFEMKDVKLSLRIDSVSSQVICLYIKLSNIAEIKQPPILEWRDEIYRLKKGHEKT